MKKSLLIMLLLSISNTALSVCMVLPSDARGTFPVQVSNWAWNGTLAPNISNNTVVVRNSNRSVLGTYSITNVTSEKSGTKCIWTQFKIPNIGNGNTWVLLEKLSGFNNWRNSILWNNIVYSRTN